VSKPPPWLKWLQELRSEIDSLQQKVKLYEEALEEIAHIGLIAYEETGETYQCNPIEEAQLALAAGKKIGE